MSRSILPLEEDIEEASNCHEHAVITSAKAMVST